MTESPRLVILIAGALTMGYAIAALFFLRFWRQASDRLFLIFAIAFAALAVQRLGLVLVGAWFESTTWLYLLRLAAFLLIVYGIVDKNRPGGATMVR